MSVGDQMYDALGPKSLRALIAKAGQLADYPEDARVVRAEDVLLHASAWEDDLRARASCPVGDDDLRAVLEKYRSYRETYAEVAGPVQKAFPSQEVQLWDALATALERLAAMTADRDAWKTAADNNVSAWQSALGQLAAARQSLEAAECPDTKTAHALAVLIAKNEVPSPWRDAGLRLYAFGRWLAALKEKHDG